MLIGLSPIRISFAGGGTDLPEYYEKYTGNVVSTAINRFTYVIIHPRYEKSFQSFSPDFAKHYKPTSFNKILIEDGTEIASSVIKYFKYNSGINVIVCSDAPGGSGLGASSSLMVNLINIISKLKNKKLSKYQIAETAFNISRNTLKWKIGKQDEYISSFGGLNFFTFKKDNVAVSKIKIKKNIMKELENNLSLYYIGNPRNSSKILSTQVDSIKSNDTHTINALHEVKILAEQMHQSLNKSDITKFGELLHKGWLTKKKFSKNISNMKIDLIYKKAMDSGAIGGKLTGAGGGGHMLFYCESKNHYNLESKMKLLGLKKINFHFYDEGPSIIDVSNNLNNKL